VAATETSVPVTEPTWSRPRNRAAARRDAASEQREDAALDRSESESDRAAKDREQAAKDQRASGDGTRGNACNGSLGSQLSRLWPPPLRACPGFRPADARQEAEQLRARA
jgi:hypothetical protein